MKAVKKSLNYIVWSILAIIFALVYMRIILGPKPESISNFMQIFDQLHKFAFIYIGLIIGSIISLLFILIDVFYLKKKLKTGINATFIRLFVLVFMTIVVGSIHYILEKVIDVI